MTPEQAMAEVAVEVARYQHGQDNRYHAGLGGATCTRCQRLGEAAATLQEQATASIGLAGQDREERA